MLECDTVNPSNISGVSRDLEEVRLSAFLVANTKAALADAKRSPHKGVARLARLLEDCFNSSNISDIIMADDNHSMEVVTDQDIPQEEAPAPEASVQQQTLYGDLGWPVRVPPAL